MGCQQRRVTKAGKWVREIYLSEITRKSYGLKVKPEVAISKTTWNTQICSAAKSWLGSGSRNSWMPGATRSSHGSGKTMRVSQVSTDIFPCPSDVWVERVRAVIAQSWNFQILEKKLWVFRWALLWLFSCHSDRTIPDNFKPHIISLEWISVWKLIVITIFFLV